MLFSAKMRRIIAVFSAFPWQYKYLSLILSPKEEGILNNMANLYIWQDSEWPKMKWQDSQLSKLLAEVNMLRGQLAGRMAMFGFTEQSDTMLDALTTEIVNSAEIEGQRLNRDSVRSSVARHLGIDTGGTVNEDHYIDGVVQVMLDATQNHQKKLDAERLFDWHAALFPTGRSGMYKITVAEWRKGEEAMQVVSGAIGREKVHYQAPPSSDVPMMMDELLQWIETENETDPLVKAAVAHLWFVTIHPFDDGNGRLCRTITEMLIARADNTARRYYSMSSEILKHRNNYYDKLEKTQKGELDITEWIEWFLTTLKAALTFSLNKTENVIRKVAFWDKHRDTPLNDRQRKVLNMLLDGFEGKLNSSKWYKINHCSQDTATRDIKDLIDKGMLRKTDEKGRSTSYEICNAPFNA